MRLPVAIAAAVLLLSLPAGADHAQTVQGRYVLTTLVGVDDIPLGFEWCITEYATDGAAGCLGGGEFHTHPVGTVSGGGTECDTTPELCHSYLHAAASAVDVLSGPNIYLIHCMPNPGGGNVCGNSDTVDGFQDVSVAGCGQTLATDATDIHAGSHHTIVFAFTFHADSATNEVCVGTQGEIPVVFS